MFMARRLFRHRRAHSEGVGRRLTMSRLQKPRSLLPYMYTTVIMVRRLAPDLLDLGKMPSLQGDLQRNTLQGDLQRKRNL